MPRARASRLAARIAPWLVFLLPLAFFANYLFPDGQGHYTGIGNDFLGLYYAYRLYYVSALAEGHLPLWSPSEGGGYPFLFSPFTASLYPLNVLSLLYYKISGSYPPLAHQWFTVLGVCILALGLYRWLRSLGFGAGPGVFSACVLGSSFKVCELLRFPNAVHAAAWLPWILYGITRCFRVRDSGSERVTRPALLALQGILLLTAGYPYCAYYSGFLVLPYVALIVVPRTRKAMFPGIALDVRQGLLGCGAALAAATACCAPYLAGMARLMRETTDRGGANFEYSTSNLFNWQDSLGALIFPPASQTEGVYYFSAAVVMLISFEVLRRPSLGRGVLIAWWAAITAVTFGRESPVFWVLWHYLPGFSSLRAWGRLNIVLVPLLAWLSAMCVRGFFEDWRGGSWIMPRPRMAAWSGFAVLVLATQLAFLRWKLFDDYWTMYMQPLAIKRFGETHAVIALLAGVIVIVIGALAYRKLASVRSGSPAWMLGAVLLIAMADLHVNGPWIWSYPATRRAGEGRIVHEAAWEVENPTVVASGPARGPFHSAMLASFRVPRVLGTTVTNSSAFSVGTLDNWFYRRFDRAVRAPKTGLALRQFRHFLGMTGQKLYCSERVDQPDAAAFLADAATCDATLRVLSYDGDRLELEVASTHPLFVVFVDNWDPAWRAYDDGVAIPVRLVFETFKAVTVSGGSHRVRFEYAPFGW